MTILSNVRLGEKIFPGTNAIAYLYGPSVMDKKGSITLVQVNIMKCFLHL